MNKQSLSKLMMFFNSKKVSNLNTIDRLQFPRLTTSMVVDINEVTASARV